MATMTQPIVSPKFKVGQKVRLKPLEELIRLGRLRGIEVNDSFRHSSVVLNIGLVNISPFDYPIYRLSNYKELSSSNWWYHEDFLQPVRQLPDHLKGKL